MLNKQEQISLEIDSYGKDMIKVLFNGPPPKASENIKALFLELPFECLVKISQNKEAMSLARLLLDNLFKSSKQSEIPPLIRHCLSNAVSQGLLTVVTILLEHTGAARVIRELPDLNPEIGTAINNKNPRILSSLLKSRTHQNLDFIPMLGAYITTSLPVKHKRMGIINRWKNDATKKAVNQIKAFYNQSLYDLYYDKWRLFYASPAGIFLPKDNRAYIFSFFRALPVKETELNGEQKSLSALVR